MACAQKLKNTQQQSSRYCIFCRDRFQTIRIFGQKSAKILSLDETPITEQYSLVKVHWGVTFKKTGDRLIEFDVSYLVQKIGKAPKIILFIAHQDEQKAMQELGLL